MVNEFNTKIDPDIIFGFMLKICDEIYVKENLEVKKYIDDMADTLMEIYDECEEWFREMSDFEKVNLCKCEAIAQEIATTLIVQNFECEYDEVWTKYDKYVYEILERNETALKFIYAIIFMDESDIDLSKNKYLH